MVRHPTAGLQARALNAYPTDRPMECGLYSAIILLVYFEDGIGAMLFWKERRCWKALLRAFEVLESFIEGFCPAPRLLATASPASMPAQPEL